MREKHWKQVVKQSIGAVLCSVPMGHMVEWATRDRVRAGGLEIDTSSPLVHSSVKAALFWGLYERSEIRFVHRYLPKDIDVIELGASLGVLSSHIAKGLRPGRQLICVEPNSSLIGQIERNVRRNAPLARCTVLNRAIAGSDNAAEVFLEVDDVNTRSRLAGIEGKRSVAVRTISLGEIVDQYELGEFALVCDIEGAEAGLLAREQSALARCRIAIVEFHSGNFGGKMITAESMMMGMVQQHGFRLVDRRGVVAVFARPEANA